MSDIKKKAQDLLQLLLSQYLAAGFPAGDPVAASEANALAIKAIAAALTPPEGYVLVPVEPTQEMVDQGTHCTHAEDWEVRSAWVYMLSHRPEVLP